MYYTYITGCSCIQIGWGDYMNINGLSQASFVGLSKGATNEQQTSNIAAAKTSGAEETEQVAAATEVGKEKTASVDASAAVKVVKAVENPGEIGSIIDTMA